MQVLPSQITPGEYFDVFYFFRDPSDASTHYVQAKLYDLRTGALLSTFALEQASDNSRLFIKKTQAPNDAPGYGRNIVAIATVYADSDYAAQDLNYAEQEQYFLIKTASPMVIGGGGGPDTRDLLDALEKMLDTRFAALPKEKPEPVLPFDALFGSIGALAREINRIPKDTYDDQQLMAAVKDLRATMDVLPQPPEHEEDFAGLADQIAALETQIKTLEDTVSHQLAVHPEQMKTLYSSALVEFSNAIRPTVEKLLSEFLDKQQLTIPISDIMRGNKSTPTPIDVSHLMAS